MIKSTSIVICGCLAILTLVICSCGTTPQDRLRDGDIVFQDLRSPQSRAIKLATGSEFSHVGIVFSRDGEFFVLEAVQPVRIIPFEQWRDQGIDGKFIVKRLRGVDTLLIPEIAEKMKSYGQTLLGKDYDAQFGWSDDRIYCSELVWKIYMEGAGIELAPLRPLRDYDLSHPEVRTKMDERYGDTPPLDEPMTSPGDIFDSPLLEAIEIH